MNSSVSRFYKSRWGNVKTFLVNCLQGRRLTAYETDVFAVAGGASEANAWALSFPAFDENGSFPIKRGSIYPAGLQIKFVDHDLHQGGGGDSEKNSQQPK